jgi:hypothetical protein
MAVTLNGPAYELARRLTEYAKWHVGVDETKKREAKARYRFPYGDFMKVHRCALLAAEARAGQYRHTEIELAVAQSSADQADRQRKGAVKRWW